MGMEINFQGVAGEAKPRAISKKRVPGLIWRQEKPYGRIAMAMTRGSVNKGCT